MSFETIFPNAKANGKSATRVFPSGACTIFSAFKISQLKSERHGHKIRDKTKTRFRSKHISSWFNTLFIQGAQGHFRS